MIFASGIFLFCFLPLFRLFYHVNPRNLKSYVIALSSYIFHGCAHAS